MSKPENAPAPDPTSASQTSGGKVKLVLDESQAFTSELQLSGYTFTPGNEVEVDSADAAKMLERRDERGHRYVSKA